MTRLLLPDLDVPLLGSDEATEALAACRQPAHFLPTWRILEALERRGW